MLRDGMYSITSQTSWPSGSTSNTLIALGCSIRAASLPSCIAAARACSARSPAPTGRYIRFIATLRNSRVSNASHTMPARPRPIGWSSRNRPPTMVASGLKVDLDHPGACAVLDAAGELDSADDVGAGELDVVVDVVVFGVVLGS